MQQLINHKLYNLKNALEQYVNFKQMYYGLYGKLQRYRDNMKIKVAVHPDVAHSYGHTHIQLANAKALDIWKKVIFFYPSCLRMIFFL